MKVTVTVETEQTQVDTVTVYTEDTVETVRVDTSKYDSATLDVVTGKTSIVDESGYSRDRAGPK